ncbi:MAG: Ig-like domain-containing protein, partial [Hyphomicrobiales bacterium]|nr:Ig-like domain-containing protein [Hyphomicrobiales bacterium]
EDGGPFFMTLSGSDPDSGDSVKEFIITDTSNLNGNLFSDALLTQELVLNSTIAADINEEAVIYYRPAENFFGSASFDYAAIDQSNDAEGDSAVVSIELVSVNDEPIATADSVTTNLETAVTFDVFANDSDVESDLATLTLDVTDNVNNGTLAIISGGQVTYTPADEFIGTDVFEYRISDNGKFSNTVTVTIGVNPVLTGNAAPVAVDDSFSTDEDVAATGNVLTNDTDSDGDSLTAQKQSDPSDGSVTLETDGSFTYTPNADFTGTDSFTYTASDGEDQSNTATVTITVNAGDNTSPTVTISAPTDPTEAFVVTVTFSESVTGFTQGDLTVTNGAVTGFEGSGTTYSITVTPTETGPVTLQVPADVAVDGADNGNLASQVVSLDYVDEEASKEESQETISRLLTKRNRITMDYRPNIRRRLQRLDNRLQNDGGISAFGLTYKDGRLPINMPIKQDEMSFSYSMLQSRMKAPAPSLTGRLAVGPFGDVQSGTSHNKRLAHEPGRLSDNHGAYLRRKNDEESAAIHETLFGEDKRHAKAEEKQETYALKSTEADYMALSPEDFNARHRAPAAGEDDRRLDFWVEGTYGGFDIDGAEGTFGVMHVGVDYLYNPNVMVGFSTQIDIVEADVSEYSTSSEGVGFMVGPYATVRMADHLILDGRVSWGQARNELTGSNGMTDEFDSDRWLVSGAVVGKFDLTPDITILPEARLAWYRETAEAYTNGLGVDIASSTVETGTLEFGPTINGSYPVGIDGRFQPFASIKGIWTFAHDLSFDNTFETAPQADTGVRARFDLGFDYTPSVAAGRMISVSGFLDGIGDEDYSVWGGSIRLKQKF